MSEFNKERKRFTQYLSQKLLELKAARYNVSVRLQQIDLTIAFLDKTLGLLKDKKLSDEEALAMCVVFYERAMEKVPELKALAEEARRYYESQKYVS